MFLSSAKPLLVWVITGVKEEENTHICSGSFKFTSEFQPLFPATKSFCIQGLHPLAPQRQHALNPIPSFLLLPSKPDSPPTFSVILRNMHTQHYRSSTPLQSPTIVHSISLMFYTKVPSSPIPMNFSISTPSKQYSFMGDDFSVWFSC